MQSFESMNLKLESFDESNLKQKNSHVRNILANDNEPFNASKMICVDDDIIINLSEDSKSMSRQFVRLNSLSMITMKKQKREQPISTIPLNLKNSFVIGDGLV